ncbi:MAG TPA: diaminopimelate epimerase [Armatimonadetes bacterium]|jgi:diaminopimelate epimerase|nr:diaminopimelate epimerase [Armatimonadota bacterium]
MQFTKMHGLGNDYIYIDAINQDLTAYALDRLAIALSNRHFGIGGDGIILIEPADECDFTMRIFNSDGSEAEMCGNGVRAFSKYVYEHGLTDATELRIMTGAGVIKPSLSVENGVVTQVRVDMGPPRLTRAEIPMAGEPADARVLGEPLEVAGQTLIVSCVSMGNPHCVIFIDSLTDNLVHGVGPQIETHPVFPARTNVEFAEVLGEHEVRMRVWERGAGETLACGTGASATAVAAIINGYCQSPVTVHLLGGELSIEWVEGGNVFMTGPATEVFSGAVHPSLLALAIR